MAGSTFRNQLMSKLYQKVKEEKIISIEVEFFFKHNSTSIHEKISQCNRNRGELSPLNK